MPLKTALLPHPPPIWFFYACANRLSASLPSFLPFLEICFSGTEGLSNKNDLTALQSEAGFSGILLPLLLTAQAQSPRSFQSFPSDCILRKPISVRSFCLPPMAAQQRFSPTFVDLFFRRQGTFYLYFISFLPSLPQPHPFGDRVFNREAYII